MSNTFSSDIDLAVFDLDGTLVNTILDLGNSVSYALRQYGFPTRTIEEYTNFVGNGTYMLIKRSVPKEFFDDEGVCRSVHKAFSDYYALHYADFSRPYENIREVLGKLKNLGVKLCVLTNKPQRFAMDILHKFFPENTFDIIFGSRDGVPKKPDPTAENEIISLMNSDSQRTVHIGDSDVDVYTAHNAGVKCIGCTWGFRTEESLNLAGADFIAHSPEDLVNIISELL